MTKLGALIIFSFWVFKDFARNSESPPQITKISFAGLYKLLITPVRELITPFKISSDYDSYGLKKFMGKEYMGMMRNTFLIDKDGNIEKIYLKVKAAIMADHIIADLGLS